MPDQIALIEVPVYETTGERGPHVLHEIAAFEILGTRCHAHLGADGDILDLSIGTRRFAVSLLDIAATAALAVEAHLRTEIRDRIIARRAAPTGPGMTKPLERARRDAEEAARARGAAAVVAVPLRGAVEADGFVTLYPRGN
jgi:hypothetical protein